MSALRRRAVLWSAGAFILVPSQGMHPDAVVAFGDEFPCSLAGPLGGLWRAADLFDPQRHVCCVHRCFFVPLGIYLFTLSGVIC